MIRKSLLPRGDGSFGARLASNSTGSSPCDLVGPAPHLRGGNKNTRIERVARLGDSHNGEGGILAGRGACSVAPHDPSFALRNPGVSESHNAQGADMQKPLPRSTGASYSKRRGWDSNPRNPKVHWFSKPARSATPAPLRVWCVSVKWRSDPHWVADFTGLRGRLQAKCVPGGLFRTVLSLSGASGTFPDRSGAHVGIPEISGVLPGSFTCSQRPPTAKLTILRTFR
jgi:hypothetical protein